MDSSERLDRVCQPRQAFQRDLCLRVCRLDLEVQVGQQGLVAQLFLLVLCLQLGLAGLVVLSLPVCLERPSLLFPHRFLVVPSRLVCHSGQQGLVGREVPWVQLGLVFRRVLCFLDFLSCQPLQAFRVVPAVPWVLVGTRRMAGMSGRGTTAVHFQAVQSLLSFHPLLVLHPDRARRDVQVVQAGMDSSQRNGNAHLAEPSSASRRHRERP